MTSPVQIPADVDREDRLLGELTARQLIILTATGLAVYLVWTRHRPDRADRVRGLGRPAGPDRFGVGVRAPRRCLGRPAVVGRTDPTPANPPRPTPAAEPGCGTGSTTGSPPRRGGAAPRPTVTGPRPRGARWRPGSRRGGCWPPARISGCSTSAGTGGRWCAR